MATIPGGTIRNVYPNGRIEVITIAADGTVTVVVEAAGDGPWPPVQQPQQQGA